MASDQSFTRPDESEANWLARTRAWVDARSREVAGEGLDGGLGDLARLNAILGSGRFGPEDTVALQALGLALGEVLASEFDGFAWWTVEDNYGRDPCLRYLETSLVLFPRTMISKRVEDGEEVDVARLYTGIEAEVARIIAEGIS